MGLPISTEHIELAESVRKVLSDRGAIGAARTTTDTGCTTVPFWKDLVSLGWLGLHIPEQYGGQGFGTAELAVVLEELGRAVAPGDFLPTVIASELIRLAGSEDQRTALLPELSAGEVTAAIGLGGDITVDADGAVGGAGGALLGGGSAEVFVLRSEADVVLVRRGRGVEVEVVVGMDGTRPSARVSCSAATPLAVLPGACATLLAVAQAFSAAEAAGGARACTEAAVAYAMTRSQFGRTIGSFQAVKHLCANMFVDTEIATAAAWDASRADLDSAEGRFAAAVAADQAIGAFAVSAQRNIQVHGGVGFTWEHDAHLLLRRAYVLRAVFGHDAARQVARLAIDGVHRPPSLELPEDADTFRRGARAFRDQYLTTPAGERVSLLARSGFAFSHWPAPYGRSAGPVEQLVIEEELAVIPKLDLGIGNWIVPTLLQQGTDEQIDRWIWSSLDGDIRWCQLFSEPGAGSDAAAISTRGVRTEGGWLVTGQKVWTSDAQNCNRGLATVRTNKDAPKHAGVSMLVIDLESDGVEIRPLRDITGDATFNEVFLDNVFVPDADVVGAVDQGWKVARATLGNERVTIGGGVAEFVDLDVAVQAVAGAEKVTDTELLSRVGHLVAERQAMRMLSLRLAARAVSGAGPGPEGNVTKLLAGEHQQRVADLLLQVGGAEWALGGTADVHEGVLFVRGLTIAGGTSEVVRNQIAERVLGLPREKM
ncbi:alkylation response protein AidB-like acyl-CoA dehydrogenase [Williamsia limnetica]|uniref:Alkylation response protein AidB-like acyl-CoA dehydrogenase n=1 Tax=Williamsia limnetica TaxID=882452 RepID=A0A318RLH7_WILLI|nr:MULTISPECIES: acyl-CoA dehydrogenase [Williamsia]OZG28851.1 acyl-CoA dehydrogenase [Williamsia sp. 1138]PYE16942.1 alkylation response protein AidB-like acyl-CoA dehydrogenase [Williamsia limnetica]